jgi:hypothetical protein
VLLGAGLDPVEVITATTALPLAFLTIPRDTTRLGYTATPAAAAAERSPRCPWPRAAAPPAGPAPTAEAALAAGEAPTARAVKAAPRVRLPIVVVLVVGVAETRRKHLAVPAGYEANKLVPILLLLLVAAVVVEATETTFLAAPLLVLVLVAGRRPAGREGAT